MRNSKKVVDGVFLISTILRPMLLRGRFAERAWFRDVCQEFDGLSEWPILTDISSQVNSHHG